MKTTFPGRSFQLWEYRVSHGQMLVRSPKKEGAPNNIDVIFAGVEYAELPRHFQDLQIENATHADVKFAEQRLGRSVDLKNVIVLKCKDRRHIVVAAAVKTTENDMDIFDSPFS